MRKKQAVSGQNWDFDGKTITVHIPMIWKRHGGRKVIVAPDGGDAWAPARQRPDEALIRALARAHRWKRLLEEGSYRSAGERAEAEGLTRSFVNRLLRLALLAPDIQEAILDGRQPKGLQLNDLALLPDDWGEQRERLIGASAAPDGAQMIARPICDSRRQGSPAGSGPMRLDHEDRLQERTRVHRDVLWPAAISTSSRMSTSHDHGSTSEWFSRTEGDVS